MGSVRNKEDITSWCFKIYASSSLWSFEHQNLPGALNQGYMALMGELQFSRITYMSFAVSLAFELPR